MKISLAVMGTLAFQGSIRWWVLRHRLHHRFTDTDSDPYDATKGLWFSHVGWIFVKTEYPKLRIIDKRDLDNDVVVSLQHRYFIPLATLGGFILPAAIGKIWLNDWIQGLLWGGIYARIAIWHSTSGPIRCCFSPKTAFSLIRWHTILESKNTLRPFQHVVIFYWRYLPVVKLMHLYAAVHE